MTLFLRLRVVRGLGGGSRWSSCLPRTAVDVGSAKRKAHPIGAGTVTVNCDGEGDITTPFGGSKQSGFGGRDKSLHAQDQYTELKTIWLDVSDTAMEEAIG